MLKQEVIDGDLCEDYCLLRHNAV